MDILPPKEQWIGMRFYSETNHCEMEITDINSDGSVKVWNHTWNRDGNTEWDISSYWNNEIIPPYKITFSNYNIWI